MGTDGHPPLPPHLYQRLDGRLADFANLSAHNPQQWRAHKKQCTIHRPTLYIKQGQGWGWGQGLPNPAPWPSIYNHEHIGSF